MRELAPVYSERSQIVILIIPGMPVFDSVTTSFSTAATGGFAIKSGSVAAYANPFSYDFSVFLKLILSINMLFGRLEIYSILLIFIPLRIRQVN